MFITHRKKWLFHGEYFWVHIHNRICFILLHCAGWTQLLWFINDGLGLALHINQTCGYWFMVPSCIYKSIFMWCVKPTIFSLRNFKSMGSWPFGNYSSIPIFICMDACRLIGFTLWFMLILYVLCFHELCGLENNIDKHLKRKRGT